MKHLSFSTPLFFLILLLNSCSPLNHLKTSESKLLNIKSNHLSKYTYVEEYKTLGHNSEPWKTSDYSGKGEFWLNQQNFYRQDTLINRRGRAYTSKTDYRSKMLLFMDYGDTTLLAMSQDMHFQKIIGTSRYTPTLVLQLFLENEETNTLEITPNHYRFSNKIGKFPVQLYLNKSNHLVDKISYMDYDPLYGDVKTTYNYSSYIISKKLSYPSTIKVEKVNGKVVENVKIISLILADNSFEGLNKPENYRLLETKKEATPKITLSKYNEYIYFIDMLHTDDKIMIVEFEDYMLVAEAPLNTRNGEVIISEVKKINAEKPIRYFVFGHHHPHYLGGLRAFVHQGSTILCTEVSKDYVHYIANAPHTINPDILQLEAKQIKSEIIIDSLELGKKNKMKIYSIGSKSAHTKDYLLYYFPNDKLLFQDDLCWIPKKGPIRKAGPRQLGLYHSIKELDLQVDTIIQSWPVNSHKVKTIIPFSDLEKSANMKE